MVQAFYPLSEATNITPETTGEWTDVDISSSVHDPLVVTGVVLHIVNAGSRNIFGLRKKGSTDARTDNLDGNSHVWAAIGVDNLAVFETYLANSDFSIYLVAYTGPDVVFFDEGIDKTPGAFSSWQDVDCSSEAPDAVALIFEVKLHSSVRTFGLRKNGSTVGSTAQERYYNSFGYLVGCDTNQVVEIFANISGGQTFYLIGYVTAGMVTFANGTVYGVSSPGPVGWEDIEETLPDSPTMAFFETSGSTISMEFLGVRKDGSTEDIAKNIAHSCIMVAVANQLVEVKSEDNVFIRLLASDSESAFVYGKIWVEGTELHYTDGEGWERFVEGAYSGDDGTAGKIGYESGGVTLRYADANGEIREVATLDTGSDDTVGKLGYEGSGKRLRHVDANGYIREIEGALV